MRKCVKILTIISKSFPHYVKRAMDRDFLIKRNSLTALTCQIKIKQPIKTSNIKGIFQLNK